jgi:hypothetical protein
MNKAPRLPVSIKNTVLLGPEDVVRSFDLILNPGEEAPGIPHPWKEVGSLTVGREVKKMPAYSFRRPLEIEVSVEMVSSSSEKHGNLKALPL